jgi:hypothetical protein
MAYVWPVLERTCQQCRKTMLPASCRECDGTLCYTCCVGERRIMK